MHAEHAIRLLLVEDHPVVLWGLKSLMLHESDVEVVGEATTKVSALAQATRLAPDLILLPYRLGGEYTGLQLGAALRGVCTAKIVIYTAFPHQVNSADLDAADDVILLPKTSGARDLMDVIRRSLGRGPDPSLDSARALAALESPESRLTDREREILHLVLRRHTNAQIGRALHIEISTVKTHVKHVLRKLGLQSRRELFDEAVLATPSG